MDIVDDPLPSPYLHELTELRSRSGRRRSTGGHRVHRVEFRRFGGMPDLERTRRAMRVAAADGSSCSQTRITSQPRSRSRSLVSESRSIFARIFARQNCSLAFGHVPCSGQPCQKQPSTKTATLSTSEHDIRSTRRILQWLGIDRVSKPHCVQQLPDAQAQPAYRAAVSTACAFGPSQRTPAAGALPRSGVPIAWPSGTGALRFHAIKPPGPRSPPTRRRTRPAVTVNSAEVALGSRRRRDERAAWVEVQELVEMPSRSRNGERPNIDRIASDRRGHRRPRVATARSLDSSTTGKSSVVAGRPRRRRANPTSNGNGYRVSHQRPSVRRPASLLRRSSPVHRESLETLCITNIRRGKSPIREPDGRGEGMPTRRTHP